MPLFDRTRPRFLSRDAKRGATETRRRRREVLRNPRCPAKSFNLTSPKLDAVGQQVLQRRSIHRSFRDSTYVRARCELETSGQSKFSRRVAIAKKGDRNQRETSGTSWRDARHCRVTSNDSPSGKKKVTGAEKTQKVDINDIEHI